MLPGESFGNDGGSARPAPSHHSEATTIRKIFAALLCAALLFPIIPTTAVAADACSIGAIRFWENSNFTGASIKYCYGVSDYEMEKFSNVTGNLGPDYRGYYLNDFDPNSGWSGIKSVSFYDYTGDNVNAHVCSYYYVNYKQVQALFHTTGNYELPFGGLLKLDIGSFRWTNVASVRDCPI